eukprot:gnl/MRDRNA2_/MRDRNA2_74764_c0_seq4.p2 gnl/MRDRNA2_/MRDRNA2_74764_c0~~gnl/MRDRNA2_/MRDRNA2_74764_c0_seq4.p2  ORF type:complete len:124 (-),score=30.95 gnl/MRDRNA2_/MRDRNA2_74764_c0_seq4:68-439(-)
MLMEEADQDNSGTITWEEFEQHARDARVQAYFNSLDLDVSEAQGLFSLLDIEDTGSVEIDDFVMGCLRLKGQAKAIDLATLIYENKRGTTRICRTLASITEQLNKLNGGNMPAADASLRSHAA